MLIYSRIQNKHKSQYTKVLIKVYLLSYKQFKFTLNEARGKQSETTQLHDEDRSVSLPRRYAAQRGVVVLHLCKLNRS